MAGRDIIVVGASAGGIPPLRGLMRQLPEDLPAAIFVVLHTAPNSPGVLAQILDKAGALPVEYATEGGSIDHGRVYVAPPDRHLMLERERLCIGRGPRENRARPAVDPLFRSAAAAYGPRVAGVILSGALDDGTAGLLAVKRGGGVAVVQDPDEAPYPGMPESVLEKVDVDFRLPVVEMGAVLARLAREPLPEIPATPEEDVTVNVNGGAYAMPNDPDQLRERLDENGERAALSCPACGGPLWKLHEGSLRSYECRIGHAYTPKTLLADQDDAVEGALSMAMRTLGERADMLDRMARDAEGSGRGHSAGSFAERAKESRTHAENIRRLLREGA